MIKGGNEYSFLNARGTNTFSIISLIYGILLQQPGGQHPSRLLKRFIVCVCLCFGVPGLQLVQVYSVTEGFSPK